MRVCFCFAALLRSDPWLGNRAGSALGVGDGSSLVEAKVEAHPVAGRQTMHGRALVLPDIFILKKIERSLSEVTCYLHVFQAPFDCQKRV